MNVIFAGYRQWAYSIEKNLLQKQKTSWKIVATIAPQKTEVSFKSLSVPLISVDPMHLEASTTDIESFSPDIILFYGWSWMIPESIYKKYTCLILHTSPLPKYRGGSPLQHQIMAGEKESAVSIFKADGGLDTGDIYGQRSFSLEGSMENILKGIVDSGIKETIHVLEGLSTNSLHPITQNETQATTYKRRKPEESELRIQDFQTKTAAELYNFIRSLEDPYPNAFFVAKDGKKIFFTSVKKEE